MTPAANPASYGNQHSSENHGNQRLAYRKKLIEVSLPLDAINAESIRRKQKAPKGFPTAIHKYWAQRPIAACRAVLFAQLVDDPSSCLDEFPSLEEQEKERKRLHGVIDAMVPWDASELALHQARFEIARSVARNGGPTLSGEWRKSAHVRDVIDYLQAHAPPVHDPFSGSGSIPLEAQRLGLRASGSDLNPVAVLIGKSLVEFPPKFAGMTPVNPDADCHVSWTGAKGIADDVRYYGRWMREQAEKRIGHLYPPAILPSGVEATVVAWLWARTVPSPDPRAKGAHVPLVSSFVLSVKKGREVVVRPIVDREAMTWTFEIDDKPSAEAIAVAAEGTVNRKGGRCLLTGTPMPFSHIREQGKAGNMRERLMAVVADGPRGRIYLSPTLDQQNCALEVPRPDAPELDQLMPDNTRDFKTPNYGMMTWASIFTARQLTAITLVSDLISEARDLVLADATRQWREIASSNDPLSLGQGGSGPTAYADAIATYLALIVDRMAFYGCTLCRWLPKDNAMGQAMGQQAVVMTWDFAEGNPIGSSSSDIFTCTKAIADAVEQAPATSAATISQAAAQNIDAAPSTLISTDPPYYDNVGYADLSDFFYVLLRRSLYSIHSELFRRVLTPKQEELVATPYRHGGSDEAEHFFMLGMSAVLSAIAQSDSTQPTTIYYAFKQAEAKSDGVTSAGWASFLQAVFNAGLIVDGTWPIRSESAGRLVAQGSNALASSIVLVCRRREPNAEIITRPDFLRRLRAEMPAALSTIRAAGVGPTDIQQAAIGPGIGIFTRYAAVLNTDGEPMSVRDALKLVNQVREEIASEGEGGYDADTRFAIDWFVAHGFAPGKAGDAISMANAANLGLADLIAAGVLEAKSGEARLLRRADMPADWDPRKDKRPTAWEACQHLIRRLEAEDGGIDAAAQLFAILGDLTDPAHQLAFRLYDICETKGWHAEGRPYNLLIQEWAEIENRAFALRDAPPAQGEMLV